MKWHGQTQLVHNHNRLQQKPCAWFFYAWRTWWRHKIETFSALLALCAGNSPVTGEFPAQRPVTRSFVVSLICAWIKGWVNNREAGDLRHRADYGVIVMLNEKLLPQTQGIYERGHPIAGAWQSVSSLDQDPFSGSSYHITLSSWRVVISVRD